MSTHNIVLFTALMSVTTRLIWHDIISGFSVCRYMSVSTTLMSVRYMSVSTCGMVLFTTSVSVSM